MKRLGVMIVLGWALICAIALFLGAVAAVTTPAQGQPLPIPDPRGYVAPDGRTFAQLIAAHVLPDPAVTPGVINPAATVAQACTPNWTKTVRPPTSWTDKLRAADAMPGHAPRDGELDHLLSIEDLGAPADPRNLWWQIYADRYGARVKDVLETKLHRMICAGMITPSQAQAALSPNWLVGYVQFVGPLP